MALTQAMKCSKNLLREASKTLFRALGLNIIFSLFSLLRYNTVGKGYTEHTKVAIHKSRTAALLRALIHIFPVSVALWEIVLNWNTYFVGYAVYNQAYYQFGAKVHEIAIEASLSAVVFTCVRYELLLGDGIPFGALFSGLQIAQASYLWSLELWGTVCSRNIPSKGKVRLLVLVIASVFLAAVAGPSSAILLVPRLDYWPAGSTNIWINVTSDSLWPSRTNVSDVPERCLNAIMSSIDTYACPSHGWEAIQDYIYASTNGLDREYVILAGGSSEPEWIEVTGRSSERRLSMTKGFDEPEGYDPYPTLATIQQTAIADVLTETGELWVAALSNVSTSGHGNVLRRQDGAHTISNNYYQPYVKVSCAIDYIHGAHDDTPVAFPIPGGVQAGPVLNQSELNESILGVYSLLYSGITRDEILDTPGSLEQYRLKWVELPQDPFNGSAIGAVISLPRSVANSTQKILVCNLGAGWGSSIINTSTFAGGTTFTTSVIDPSDYGHLDNPYNQNVTEDNNIEQDISPQAEAIAADSVISYWLPVFPEKRITVTEAWANYMNPFVPALNTSVIDALMSTPKHASELTSIGQTLVADWALAALLANGLASIGANAKLQGNISTVVESDGSRQMDGNYWFSGKGDIFTVDPEESKDWVKLRVESTISGYAYNIRGAAPKVAISFLLAYCIIALGHISYAAISGISSTCWDSIGEVTALAMNSTPTVLLKNTCAGIMELNIFKLPVRVLAMQDAEGDGEHLELVFGNADEKDARGTPIQPNRVYGTMPKMAEKDKSE